MSDQHSQEYFYKNQICTIRFTYKAKEIIKGYIIKFDNGYCENILAEEFNQKAKLLEIIAEF